MKAISKGQSQGKTWEKIPKTSSLYRYIPKGTFYMVARINGKLVRESLQTTDLQLAKKKVEDAKEKRKQITGEITLIKLAEDFKASKNGKNQKQISTQIQRLKESCPFCDTSIRKINPIDLSKYISSLNLSPRTNNIFFETLKGIFEIGVIGGYIDSNPMDRLKKILRKKINRKEPEIPTMEQFNNIIKFMREQKHSDTAEDSANLVEFMGLSALGTIEAVSLTWKQVNFETSRISVKRIKTGQPFTVPIYPALKPLLERLYAASKTKAGKVFSVNDPKKAIATACKKLGYPHFTARNFRQMGIVNLLRAGISPKLVAKYQGHQDGGVLIMNTYSQVISDNDSDYEKEQLKKLEVVIV